MPNHRVAMLDYFVASRRLGKTYEETAASVGFWKSFSEIVTRLFVEATWKSRA